MLYEKGNLKVEFVIFQCIGYNLGLANTLTHYENSTKGHLNNMGLGGAASTGVEVAEPSLKWRKTIEKSFHALACSDMDSDMENSLSEDGWLWLYVDIVSEVLH